MYITDIHIKNYKVFKDVKLQNIGRLNIIVGANGSGKTTLFDVFGFLKDALKDNVQVAIQRRGGYKEVISRDAKGKIEIELKFRLDISGKSRLVTYLIIIGENQGKAIIEREILKYKRSNYGSPFHFLDFQKGKGNAINNEADFDKKDEELEREEQVLDSPETLAIKGLGQFKRFKAANAFRNFIENWHVSDFHIKDARPSQEAGYAEHLSETGNNLPLVAKYTYENHPEIFNTVLKKMAQRVPGIEKVEAVNTEDGRIILKFQDGSFKDPFIGRYVSDGTIKMFAYLLLLHDPKPHPFLCIEEPENQLYPTLMHELVEEFRDYARRGGQVFVSTHSPDLLNAAKPDETMWLVKEKGFSRIMRASDDDRIKDLINEGAQMGYLWKQDYFTRSNP